MPLTAPPREPLEPPGIEPSTRAEPAEHAVRESEARLRVALAIAGLGAWETDFAAGRTTWDAGTAALLRVPHDQSVAYAGRWLDFIHPHDRERVEHATLATLRSGTPYTEEYRVRRLDGVERIFASRGVRAAPHHLVGVVQDVTDIRRAQAALAESEARLRALANMMPEAIWTARPDGQVDWYNDRWYDYTGLKRSARGDESWMPVVHPDDLDACRDAWQRAVAAGTRYDIEYRLRRHDGAYRWHLGRAVPRCDEGGGILCWFGACIDIDDQKRAEEVLLHNRDELERRVEERTRALERTQTQLAQSQRLEALGQLAGGIAHDFNNVLQAIETSASLIERHAADPGEVRRLAGTITSAAERGATVTRRLLAFSRRGALRAEPVDPHTLLTSMREMLAHALGGGVEICLDAGVGLPALLADKGQLETVLVNLATNARDAMDGSGVLSLSAETETVTQSAPPLHPPALRAGQYIRLSVTDGGTGMDAATLARASEPFFTTKQPGKGTGLGLAMARGFAEQSGGALQIESAPGQGTTVRLWLPLVKPLVAAPTAESGEAATGATPASGHRLMLVDDDEDVLDALVGHMTALGYVVRPVQSAVEALAWLDAGEKVDLIVSDLSMPEMDGMTLIGEAQRRQPALPAVLLTGFATDAAEIAARQLPGTVALLHKPIRGRVLAGHVADLLRRRQAAP